MFLIFICLAMTYTYCFYFVLLMSTYLPVISFVILMNIVLFLLSYNYPVGKWRILNITSCSNTNRPVPNFSVLWYVLRIQYAAADITPVQSDSKSSDSYNPLIRTMFDNV